MYNEDKWVIHKHTLQSIESYVAAPARTQFLSAGLQKANVVVWYLRPVDNEDMATFKIRAVGTGHEMLESEFLNFLGTVQIDSLVWHIFYSKG